MMWIYKCYKSGYIVILELKTIRLFLVWAKIKTIDIFRVSVNFHWRMCVHITVTFLIMDILIIYFDIF